VLRLIRKLLMRDISKRWENYRRANQDRPSVRENERRRVFELVNPQPGQRILEVGTGNGFLTFPLAEAVGHTGQVTTADVTEENIDDVERSNAIRKLNITTLLFDENDEAPFSKKHADFFDAVVSLATLHHFDNRAKGTGERGRRRVLTEFHQVLKPDGKLILADPADDTITQKYFDRIDNPKYCFPEGHPHDFFRVERLREVVKELGFRDIAAEVRHVPWKFDSEKAAKDFVHTIHNAQCGEEESFAVAQEVLGLKKANRHYELGWELFFLTAHK